MSAQLLLPDVGEGIEEAEIVGWLVAVGEVVERDQPLVEVMTDKAAVELPSPAAGTVTALHGAPGEVVKVGSLLVELDGGAGALAPVASPDHRVEAGDERVRPRRVKASPALRARARAAGIDLAEVRGTGPGGRVTDDDLTRRLESAPDSESSAKPEATKATTTGASDSMASVTDDRLGSLGRAAPGPLELTGIRRASAAAVTAAWREIPHIGGFDEFDATNLLSARSLLEERTGHRLPLTVFFVAAAASTLRRFPLVNATFDGDLDRVDVQEACNVGVAASTARGLVVPVVSDADRRGLVGIAEELARLIRAARDGRVSPGELRGGTFTVTNYGALGGWHASPIIRAPEVGIAGFGAVRQRPQVVGDQVLARPTIATSVAFDHRVVDGDLAVAFQSHLLDVLSEPVLLAAS